MLLFKLATETAGEIMSDAGLTIVIGFVVVFAVLLLLTGVFKGFGVVMSGTQKKKETPVTAAPAVAPVAAAPAAAPVELGPVMSSAEVRNGIEPEVTAVIAAAVASCMPAGQKYSIKKIDLAD